MSSILTPCMIGVGVLLATLEVGKSQLHELTTIVHFDGTNGANPQNAALVFGNDSKLYGTTYSGGSSNCGTVFSVDSNGAMLTEATFYGTNGQNPNAALTLGSDGAFYGTTYYGGSSPTFGTVFRMTTNGILTPLVNFNNSTYPGKNPKTALTLGSDSKLYGTTLSGGTGGQGTIFCITTNGTLDTMVTFYGTNGAFPTAALIQGQNQLFYGVTAQGVTYDQGKAFSISTNGDLSLLTDFGDKLPNTLAFGSNDQLYGTTYQGGDFNMGTVFKMTTNGTVTTLFSFNSTNGAFPSAGLVLGANGVFYGTTANGGGSNLGTIFSITTNGTLTTLATFYGTNGAYPYAALTLGANGVIYGNTSQGGNFNKGTVFRLSPQPPPVLNIAPIPGSVVLSWSNSLFGLQSAPDVSGVFTNIPGSASPFTSSITGNRQFFRLQK